MNHIFTRVSIRKYQDRSVEKEKTMAILQRRKSSRIVLMRAVFTM